MSDPLSQLRDFTISKKQISLEGNHIVFGATRFARNAPTAYKNKGGFYPVDALWFLLQNAEAKPSEYITACKAQDIAAVSIVDKKAALAYLRGQVETSPSVDYATAVIAQVTRGEGRGWSRRLG